MTDDKIIELLNDDDARLIIAMRDVIDNDVSVNAAAKKYEINIAVLSTAIRTAKILQILEDEEEKKNNSRKSLLNTL